MLKDAGFNDVIAEEDRTDQVNESIIYTFWKARTIGFNRVFILNIYSLCKS